jgi:hypothetical protein
MTFRHSWASKNTRLEGSGKLSGGEDAITFAEFPFSRHPSASMARTNGYLTFLATVVVLLIKSPPSTSKSGPDHFSSTLSIQHATPFPFPQ